MEKLKSKYCSHEGRIGRLSFFLRSLFVMLVGFVPTFLAGLIFYAVDEILGSIVAVIVYLPFIAMTYCLAIRRLHDLNKTGWLVLVNLIPYVNIPFGIWLLFAKGTVGPNQYGPDPLMPENAGYDYNNYNNQMPQQANNVDQNPYKSNYNEQAEPAVQSVSAAKFCPNCGEKNDKMGAFCSNCGTKL